MSIGSRVALFLVVWLSAATAAAQASEEEFVGVGVGGGLGVGGGNFGGLGGSGIGGLGLGGQLLGGFAPAPAVGVGGATAAATATTGPETAIPVAGAGGFSPVSSRDIDSCALQRNEGPSHAWWLCALAFVLRYRRSRRARRSIG